MGMVLRQACKWYNIYEYSIVNFIFSYWQFVGKHEYSAATFQYSCCSAKCS